MSLIISLLKKRFCGRCYRRKQRRTAGVKYVHLLGNFGLKRKENLVVLIGSEGQGLSKQLKEGSNRLIQIKNECKNKEFPNTLVDSLNVNAATSIILYELKKQLK